MSTGPDDRSQSEPAGRAPTPENGGRQGLEAQLRRSSMRDRLLQALDWLYPYAAERLRGMSRRKQSDSSSVKR
jgi:hypothetical protein